MSESQGFLVAAGILFVLSIALFWWRARARGVLEDMWAVDTYDSRELKRLCSGDLHPTVEIQGTVSCDKPVVSPAAGVPCCWVHTLVQRQQQKSRRVLRGGHWQTETYTDWDTVFDRTDCAVFKVEDETGGTLVNPMGAEIDTEEVCDRTVYAREDWFGGESLLDVGPYRITERAFTVGGYAYVLGQASLRGGQVMVHCPDEGYLDPKRRVFLVSRKTERELTRSKQLTVSLCFWFGAAALLLAGFCALYGLGVFPQTRFW